MYHLIYDPDTDHQDFCLLYTKSLDDYADLICDWRIDPHNFYFWNIGEDSTKYTLTDYLDNSDTNGLDFILLTSFDYCPTISDILSFLSANHPQLLL